MGKMRLKELATKARLFLESKELSESKDILTENRIMDNDFLEAMKTGFDGGIAEIKKNCNEISVVQIQTSKNMAKAAGHFEDFANNLKG